MSVKLAPWEVTIHLMESQAARGWMPWLGQADSLLTFWKQMSLQLAWFWTRMTLLFEHLSSDDFVLEEAPGAHPNFFLDVAWPCHILLPSVNTLSVSRNIGL